MVQVAWQHFLGGVSLFLCSLQGAFPETKPLGTAPRHLGQPQGTPKHGASERSSMQRQRQQQLASPKAWAAPLVLSPLHHGPWTSCCTCMCRSHGR